MLFVAVQGFRSGVVVVFGEDAAGDIECGRCEAQLLADVVMVANQLSYLAAVLAPWNLADRCAVAHLQLADEVAATRFCGEAAFRVLHERHRRLAHIMRGLERVVAMHESEPLMGCRLTRILEIYAAAIASSALIVGCEELTLLAESSLAMLMVDWDVAPQGAR